MEKKPRQTAIEKRYAEIYKLLANHKSKVTIAKCLGINYYSLVQFINRHKAEFEDLI